MVLGRHQSCRLLVESDRRILDGIRTDGEALGSGVSRLDCSAGAGCGLVQKFHSRWRQVVLVTEGFVEVGVGIRAAVDKKIGGDGVEAGQGDGRVDELEAVLIEANRERGRVRRGLVVIGQVDGHQAGNMRPSRVKRSPTAFALALLKVSMTMKSMGSTPLKY